MQKDSERPQINASNLRVGGELVGALFVVGSMLIFMIGIPLLRYVFPAAIVLGCLVALVLHRVRHENPGKPWLRAAIETEPKPAPRSKAGRTSDRSTKVVIVPLADPI